jgi:transposase
MPCKVDKIALTREQDHRYKTTKADCEEMRKLAEQGFTRQEIAQRFGVSHTTVTYIVNARAREKQREYKKKNPNKSRPREEHTEYMRSLRERKKELLKEEQDKIEQVLGGGFSVYQFKSNKKTNKQKMYSK